jgi:HEAT repeat protein
MIDLRDSAVVVAEERGIHWAPESDDVILGGLLTALKSDDQAVSTRAESSLKRIDSERLAVWLRARLDTAEPELVAEIASVAARLRLIELVPDLVKKALDSSALNLEAIGGSLKDFPHFQELIDWIQAPPDAPSEAGETAAELRDSGLLTKLENDDASERLDALAKIPAGLQPGTLSLRLSEVAVADPSDDVRSAAIGALKTASTEVRVAAATEILKRGSVPLRLEALGLLSGGTVEEMSLLVGMLHDKSPRVAKQAIAMIGAQPVPGALAVLWGALLGVSRDRQQLIMELLNRFDAGAVTVLARQVLGSANARERMLGVWVLASIDPVGSRSLLLDALTDPAPEVRLEALGGMWGVREPEIVEAVGARVKDPDPSVRAIAVGVLGGLDPEISVRHLLDASKDPDDGVRHAAEEALLGQRAEAVAPALVSALQEPSQRRTAKSLLLQLGKVGVPALLPALATNDAEVREVIGELLTEAAAEAFLVAELDARSPERRSAALDGLLAMGASDNYEAIVARLEDPVTMVRVRAAEVLGALHEERALDALKRTFVSDPDMSVVAAVETALRAITGDQPNA